MVGAQRSRTVTARVVGAHQQPVGLFAQRVVADEALRRADRRGPVAALLRLAGESLERVEVEIAQPLALLEQPVVVAALEQIARVRPDRVVQPAVRERLLEDGDVQPQRRVGTPLKRPWPDVDQAVGIRHRSPQGVQDMAEVRPRLRLTGVGPEEEGKPLARLRGVAVQQQVGEQRLGAAGVEGRHLRFAQAKVQATEQPYAERRRSAHRSGSLRASLRPPRRPADHMSRDITSSPSSSSPVSRKPSDS